MKHLQLLTFMLTLFLALPLAVQAVENKAGTRDLVYEEEEEVKLTLDQLQEILDKADQLYNADKYAEAIPQYRLFFKGIEAHFPTDHDVLLQPCLNLGMSQYNLEDWVGAAATLDRCIPPMLKAKKVDPAVLLAAYYRADSLLRQDKTTQGQEALLDALPIAMRTLGMEHVLPTIHHARCAGGLPVEAGQA